MDNLPQPVIASLLCSSDAIQDAFTRRWSYINIFNVIVLTDKQENSYESFFVVGRLNNVQAGSANVDIYLVGPGSKGKELARATLTGTLVEGDAELTARFNLVKFSKTGRYYLHVSKDGTILEDNNKYYIDVKK